MKKFWFVALLIDGKLDHISELFTDEKKAIAYWKESIQKYPSCYLLESIRG